MPPNLYKYGSERTPGEGMRIGVAHYLPRGVRRENWGPQGWFDSWLPVLAPSAALVKRYVKKEISYTVFSRRYRAEMKSADHRQIIRLLAVFSSTTAISLGCFCADETTCHRSILRQLIHQEISENMPTTGTPDDADDPNEIGHYASPVCLSAWAEKGLL